MTILSTQGISLAYGDDVILSDVSFSINEGDKLGIVGVNGAGKSTLLRIITKKTEPTSGYVYISGGKTVMMLDQAVSLDEKLTLKETILECSKDLAETEKKLDELNKRMLSGETSLAGAYSDLLEKFIQAGGLEYKNRAGGILKSLSFPESRFDTPVSFLSGGEKTRLALGRILYQSPDIMILDEPTNHLDISSLRYLEDHLANYKKTIIVVSHDRYFLDKVTNKTLDIENCKAKLYNGNYSTYSEKKKNDREVQAKHYALQQKEITRIKDIIAQQVTWSQERNYKIIATKQKMIDRMVKVEKPENLPENARISFPDCTVSGNDVLTLLSLTKSFGEKHLFKDFDYLLKRGDRTLIIGDNGCGKSTLLKIITDKITADNGEKYFGYNVQPGYYDQENQQLHVENTVFGELLEAFPEKTVTSLRNILAQFGFKSDDVFKLVGNLSGGEKAKLTICKLVTAKSNLLILDEPTNHLDIPTREILEDAILAYNGTVIAVSHDRYFIRKLATKLIVFEGGEKPICYDGGYDDYLFHKENLNISDDISKSPSANIKDGDKQSRKESYLNDKKKASEERQRQRRIEKIKTDTSLLEKRLTEIEKEIAENETDHIALTKLYSERDENEEKLLELYGELESYGEYK